MNVSVCGPSVLIVRLLPVTISRRWMTYPMMIPFWLLNGGGLQLMERADELNTVASTDVGGAVGAAGKILTSNSFLPS